MFGRDADDEMEVVVLGRMERWGKAGVALEADDRHCELNQKGGGIEPGSHGVDSRWCARARARGRSRRS